MTQKYVLKPISFEQLFYTPLFRYKLQDHATLDAALLTEGERMRTESEGVNKSNRNGWHSKGNIFAEEANCFRVLQELATKVVYLSTNKVTDQFDPTKEKMKLFGWMNHNPTGGYNAPHTHPGAHWSGVYYVSQPEVEGGSSGGKIEFMDPRSDLPFWRKFKSNAFRHKAQIRPEAGEIVLFPSYLLHWVYPNESDQARVTIAFNATFPD